MAFEDDDPLMVSCLLPQYVTADSAERKSHHEIDWSMEIKIDGFEGFVDMPPETFSELIRSRVEDAARQGIRQMRTTPNTLPQFHLEESASLDYTMETERLWQFETKANPFIGIFHLKGHAVVDTKLPVTADESIFMIQRRLVAGIASRVAQLANDRSQINGPSGAA